MFRPELKGVASLPLGHEDRKAVAHQLQEARKHDRLKEWNDTRNGYLYSYTLRGISATFDEVRRHGQSQIVLDIGTGSSKGIQEISQAPFASGLSFQATALKRNLKHEEGPLKDKIILTSAEVLRGIPPASIGCILAVRSISYTARPQLLAQRLDQVLAEGGIIKAVFTCAETELRERTGKELALVLKGLGYDVAYTPGEVYKVFGSRELKGDEVLLARKPYTDPTRDLHPISAQDLLTQDEQHRPSEMEYFKTTLKGHPEQGSTSDNAHRKSSSV